MKRINLLDDQTCNKIAAGEVIERPFSVVKELVENSIDAGAKNITVEIQEGGQKLIKVVDDGHGIHPDDIEKAFLPHATSKIKDSEDIFSINTLGFRGEALASIASVAQTITKSRNSDFDFGKKLCIDGGVKHSINDVGFNVGTSIQINNLFYNVPARQKFLKSSQRESALISDIVSRLALVNTDISFKLISNERTVLNTYGNGNLEDVIRILYGKITVDNIIGFESHGDIASIYGYVGNSEISRKSRGKQSIFVNKRYIRSSLITAAVENAFKSFLTINKFPFFVLFLDIYPEYVDVNVHPTKSEVKFSNDREIFKLVFDSVHRAIAESMKKSFTLEIDPAGDEALQSLHNKQKNHIDTQISLPLEQISIPPDLKSSSLIHESMSLKDIIQKPNDNSQENFIMNNIIIDDVNHRDIGYNKENIVEKEYKNNEDMYKINENIKAGYSYDFLDIKVIGQFNNSYIVGEYNKELYIIDQHAAHEKVLFERYKKEISNREVVSQGLISPLIIELSNEDFPYYKENEECFIKLGFTIEEFGFNSIYIREVPMILGETNVKSLFFNILDNIKDMGTGEIDDVKYHKIATLACKAAVKANDKLSELEMKALIEDLKKAKEPFNCPHGRPTIIKFTLNELEKRFKRIQ